MSGALVPSPTASPEHSRAAGTIPTGLCHPTARPLQRTHHVCLEGPLSPTHPQKDLREMLRPTGNPHPLGTRMNKCFPCSLKQTIRISILWAAWRSQWPPAAAPKAGVPPYWASPASHPSSRTPSHINPLSTSLFLRPCSQGHPDCNRDPTSTNPNTGNLGKLVMPSI